MRSATVALSPPSRPSTLASDPRNVPEASGSGSASRQQEPAVPFGEDRYQLLALCNAVLAGAAFLIHLFSVRLTAHVMDHWCGSTDAFANMTPESWKEMAIPMLEDGTHSHCTSLTLVGDPPNVPEASGSGSASRQQEPALPFGEGRYQLLAVCNAVLEGAAFLIHLFSVRLTAHVMDHWCRPTEAFANMTPESWKEMAISILENGTRSHCTSLTFVGDPPNVPEASGSGSASRQQEPALPFGEGRYQLLALCNAVLAGAAFLIHLFSVRLTALVMDHWCRPAEAFANMAPESWKEMAISILENGTRSHCTRCEPPDGGPSPDTVPCFAWEFDMSEYGDNIVSEWQLVCQRHWLLELSLYTNFVASVVWVPMMGVAADRVGRRIVVYVSIPALLITGSTSSLTGSFQFLVALRTVASATIVSVATVTFPVLHEVVPANRRRVYCFVALALGQVIAAIPFAIFAALKLSWNVVYFVVRIPTSLLVITLYAMDESYLWLLAQCRTKEAERLAMRAARINGVPPETCHTNVAQGNRNGDAEVAAGRRPDSIFSAKLQHHTLLISSIWAAVNFTYSQANLTDIFPVRPCVAFVGVLLLGPVLAVLCPAIRLAGLRRVIVGSALILSLIALYLATTYRIQTPLSGTIVVVGLRLMGNLNASLDCVLAVDSYPTTARCTDLAFAISMGRLAGSCGEIMFHFTPGQRKYYPIAAMTIVMATVAVAADHFPKVVYGAPCSVNPAAPFSEAQRHRQPSAHHAGHAGHQGKEPNEELGC